MLLLCALFLFQNIADLELKDSRPWSELSMPWMTAAERRLFESLSLFEQQKFQGFFVARRLSNPLQWPKTGLFLPLFFARTTHGDIRDQLIRLLGPPLAEEPGPGGLPQRWSYPAEAFDFEWSAGGILRLTPPSQRLWEHHLETLVIRPEIRYDFRSPSFFYAPPPADLEWFETEIPAWRLLLDEQDYRVLVTAPALSTFGKPTVEGDIALQLQLVIETSAGETIIRQGVDRLAPGEETAYFLLALPSGFHRARLRFYSGLLPRGYQAQVPLFIPPKNFPRISSPLLFQSEQSANIELPAAEGIFLGDTFYQLHAGYQPGQAASVLVQADLDEVHLLKIDRDGNFERLERLEQARDLSRFALPPMNGPFKLLAYASEVGEIRLPFSTWVYGDGFSFQPDPSFQINDRGQDYIVLDSLKVTSPGLPVFAYAGGFPYLGSASGSWPWTPYDWGPSLELAFEYESGGAWRSSSLQLPRSESYSELRISHPHILLGMRDASGAVIPPEPLVHDALGSRVPYETSSIESFPTLTGVLVTDTLARSGAWTPLRQRLISWLKSHTAAKDALYVIHASAHPMLVQPPTQQKAVIEATLRALPHLIPGDMPPLAVRQERSWSRQAVRRLGQLVTEGRGQPTGSMVSPPNIKILERRGTFGLDQFIDGLMNLGRNHEGPHRVFVLTTQLQSEKQTTHLFLDGLREAGMQFFVVEMPWAQAMATTTYTQPLSDRGRDGLKFPVEPHIPHDNLKGFDNIPGLAEPNNANLLGFKWGNKKGKAYNKAKHRIELAFMEGLLLQTALRSAGIGLLAAGGSQELNRYFAEIEYWQRNLVHIVVPTGYDPIQLSISGADGAYPFWVLVPWGPDAP